MRPAVALVAGSSPARPLTTRRGTQRRKTMYLTEINEFDGTEFWAHGGKHLHYRGGKWYAGERGWRVRVTKKYLKNLSKLRRAELEKSKSRGGTAD